MRIQIEALKHKTHFLAHLVQIRLRIGNIDTVHPNLAALNAFKLVNGTDERRFAAASEGRRRLRRFQNSGRNVAAATIRRDIFWRVSCCKAVGVKMFLENKFYFTAV